MTSDNFLYSAIGNVMVNSELMTQNKQDCKEFLETCSPSTRILVPPEHVRFWFFLGCANGLQF